MIYNKIYAFLEKVSRHIRNHFRVMKFRINPNIYIGKNVTIEESVVLSTRGGGQNMDW